MKNVKKDNQMRTVFCLNTYFKLMSKIKRDISRLINVELHQGMVCSLTL
jgi:hypothetical protein